MFIITSEVNGKVKHQSEQYDDDLDKAINTAKEYEKDSDYATVMDNESNNAVYITGWL